MTTPYFSMFPTTVYSNTICKDISRRIKIRPDIKHNLSMYYTYDVKDGTRADLIADAVYNDPTLDWMIWLNNESIDPYYDWNLSENDFARYLIKKYGSIENSIRKIACYRNNWYDDDTILPPEFYNNTLRQEWKKYYSPFYGDGVKVLYWKRREEDWVVETNQIWKITVNDTSQYSIGDILDFYNDSEKREGGGEVTKIDINNNTVFIKNVDGIISDNIRVEGVEEQEVLSGEIVYIAITLDEAVFWSPVTCYDLENEKNTYARQIRLLERETIFSLTQEISDALNS